MATATRTSKSLKVVCPHCLDGDGITLDLNSLGEITCGACSETFSAKQAAAMLQAEADKWARVASWLDAAPID